MKPTLDIMLARTTAALLQLGENLDAFGNVLWLVWFAILLISPLIHEHFTLLFWLFFVLAGVFGVLQKYYALRTSLDAQLFHDCAENVSQTASQLELSLSQLDAALQRLNLRIAPTHSRTLQERSRSALFLLRKQGIALCLQASLIGLLLACNVYNMVS